MEVLDAPDLEAYCRFQHVPMRLMFTRSFPNMFLELNFPED